MSLFDCLDDGLDGSFSAIRLAFRVFGCLTGCRDVSLSYRLTQFLSMFISFCAIVIYLSIFVDLLACS